jgi:hypothetical protein
MRGHWIRPTIKPVTAPPPCFGTFLYITSLGHLRHAFHLEPPVPNVPPLLHYVAPDVQLCRRATITRLESRHQAAITTHPSVTGDQHPLRHNMTLALTSPVLCAGHASPLARWPMRLRWAEAHPMARVRRSRISISAGSR